MNEQRTEETVVFHEPHACVQYLLYGLNNNCKQWAIEMALRVLCEDEWVDRAKEHFGWETGAGPNE